MQPATSDKTFHLKWNNHLQNLSQLFTTIYSSSALADVTLSCRDGSIRAHKLVLSACSPYFEQIFKDNPCKHPVIILKGIPYTEINSLVEFMYKGSVDVQELDLQSLMHTASELEIRGLAYELRKDASSLLNVNLNESPFYASTPLPSREAYQAPSVPTPYDATPRNVNAYQTNMERLRQIHMYQQAMCPTAGRQPVEAKRKRKSDDPMPATTTTAVKNILEAAAKELAQAKSSTEDDSVKKELDEDDNESEGLSHNRDTRFKGKKRVSIGLQHDYTEADVGATKGKQQPKKSVKYMIKPTEDAGKTDESVSKLVISTVSGAESSVVKPPGILKCVNLDQLREHRTSKVPEDNDDSSPLDTSDDNNLQTSFEQAEGPEEDYDSSDSKTASHKLDKLYKCDLCDLSFNRSSHLARHRRTHTGERPYRCEACGRCFARGDKLKLHMRICEKDEFVPSHSVVTEDTPKQDGSSSTLVPGAVSVLHSERRQLMFTPGGDVMLADEDAAPSSPSSYYGTDYPVKRGRGRPRKKPLPPVCSPQVKKKRGRPPKVIKMMDAQSVEQDDQQCGSLLQPIQKKRGRPPKDYASDPMDSSRSMDNYTSSNLPYGDFSYLTDIISTHFTQPGVSPAAATTAPIKQPHLEKQKSVSFNLTPMQTQRYSVQTSTQMSPPYKKERSASNEDDEQEHDKEDEQSDDKLCDKGSDEHLGEDNDKNVDDQLDKESEKHDECLDKASDECSDKGSNENLDKVGDEHLDKDDNKHSDKDDDKHSDKGDSSDEATPESDEKNMEKHSECASPNDSKTEDEPPPSKPLNNSMPDLNILEEKSDKVMMVGDCQILKIDSAYESTKNVPEQISNASEAVATIGDCTIQPVMQND